MHLLLLSDQIKKRYHFKAYFNNVAYFTDLNTNEGSERLIDRAARTMDPSVVCADIDRSHCTRLQIMYINFFNRNIYSKRSFVVHKSGCSECDSSIYTCPELSINTRI